MATTAKKTTKKKAATKVAVESKAKKALTWAKDFVLNNLPGLVVGLVLGAVFF